MKKKLCLALLLLVGMPTFSQVALAAAPGAIPIPGDTPDYFGPYSNWANSPLPSGSIAAITIVSGGTGYTAAPMVTITDVYRAAPVPTTATVIGGAITAIVVPAGTFTAPVVNITDSTGLGAIATATITPAPGIGIRKFIDTLPNLVFATPDVVTYPDSDYYEIELGEYDTPGSFTRISTQQSSGVIGRPTMARMFIAPRTLVAAGHRLHPTPALQQTTR